MFVPRAIVFDLDGTLLNTAVDIATACNHALLASGRPPLKQEEILRYVGDGARRLCARASGLSSSDEALDTIVDSFISYYLDHPADHTCWMPQALQILDTLHDLPLAICTNKPRPISLRVLSAMNALDRFTVIVAGGDAADPKPSPEPVLTTARQLGVTPREIVMVGDGPQDVLAGRAAGCRTVALANGFNGRGILSYARPDILVESLEEAADVIRRWRESTVRSKASSA